MSGKIQANDIKFYFCDRAREREANELEPPPSAALSNDDDDNALIRKEREEGKI